MSSNATLRPRDNPAAPFQRPYPTYANHISDLLRGPSRNPAPSDASSAAIRPNPRAPPTQAESDQRRRNLIESMMIQYPPNTQGVVEARSQGGPKPEDPEGFSQELDNIVDAKQEMTKRYEEFHTEWTDLQDQLQKKANELRTKYAELVERIRELHHKHIRGHVKKDDYNLVRAVLTEQMDDVFVVLRRVVVTLGTMYAESRAVAQGANPTGDYDYGKLNVAACSAAPFLVYKFPEFVKQKPSSVPPDPFGPRPSEVAFKDGLPSLNFHDLMEGVWSKHPTKLQDIHQAVYKDCFAGIKELTQRERDNVNALLGNGGQWSM